MPWFKVDDSFYRGPKVRKLGRDRVPAVGLWTLCGDWSADNLTDGFVPWEIVEEWDPDRAWANRLLDVLLWEEAEVDGEKGVLFHDWCDWQPTKDQVRQRRKADAERRARWREAQRERAAKDAQQRQARALHSVSASQCDTARDSHSDATVTHIRDSVRDAPDVDLFGDEVQTSRRDSGRESRQESALPDPTRPDPVLPTEVPEPEMAGKPARRKRPALPLPDTWRPNDNHAHFAREFGLDLQHEARQFRAHAEANDRRQASWDAAFRQWLGNAVKWAKPARRKAAAGADPERGIHWEQ